VLSKRAMSAPPITNAEVWQIGRPGSKSVDVGQRARHRWLGIGGHDLLPAADSAADPVFKATREPGMGHLRCWYNWSESGFWAHRPELSHVAGA
jgi:hypothetical protein